MPGRCFSSIRAAVAQVIAYDAPSASSGKASLSLAMAALFPVVLAGCQSGGGQASGGGGKSASLRAMEQVAIAAHKCWFAAKDPAFRPYRMANELNSFSGQPRFLLVPVDDYGGRPLLVVQARGSSPRVEVFGPLLGEPLGARIGADVNRWSSGDGACGGPA